MQHVSQQTLHKHKTSAAFYCEKVIHNIALLRKEMRILDASHYSFSPQEWKWRYLKCHSLTVLDLAILQTSTMLLLSHTSSRILEMCLMMKLVWGTSYERRQFSSLLHKRQKYFWHSHALKSAQDSVLHGTMALKQLIMSNQRWQNVTWYCFSFTV